MTIWNHTNNDGIIDMEWIDSNDNGIMDAGEWVDLDGNFIIDLATEWSDDGNDYLDAGEWHDYNNDTMIDVELIYYENEWVFNIEYLEDYWWDVKNDGVRLMQIRFYPVFDGKGSNGNGNNGNGKN